MSFPHNDGVFSAYMNMLFRQPPIKYSPIFSKIYVYVFELYMEWHRGLNFFLVKDNGVKSRALWTVVLTQSWNIQSSPSKLVLACHYNDDIMGVMASQINSLTIVYSIVYSGADQRKRQSSALLAICAGNSPATGEFPAQMANNAENVSIWWRHHGSAFFVFMVYWFEFILSSPCAR